MTIRTLLGNFSRYYEAFEHLAVGPFKTPFKDLVVRARGQLQAFASQSSTFIDMVNARWSRALGIPEYAGLPAGNYSAHVSRQQSLFSHQMFASGKNGDGSTSLASNGLSDVLGAKKTRSPRATPPSQVSENIEAFVAQQLAQKRPEPAQMAQLKQRLKQASQSPDAMHQHFLAITEIQADVGAKLRAGELPRAQDISAALLVYLRSARNTYELAPYHRYRAAWIAKSCDDYAETLPLGSQERLRWRQAAETYGIQAWAAIANDPLDTRQSARAVVATQLLRTAYYTFCDTLPDPTRVFYPSNWLTCPPFYNPQEDPNIIPYNPQTFLRLGKALLRWEHAVSLETNPNVLAGPMFKAGGVTNALQGDPLLDFTVLEHAFVEAKKAAELQAHSFSVEAGLFERITEMALPHITGQISEIEKRGPNAKDVEALKQIAEDLKARVERSYKAADSWRLADVRAIEADVWDSTKSHPAHQMSSIGELRADLIQQIERVSALLKSLS